MCDILVLTFQTETTRVCMSEFHNDHGTLRFPHLGVNDMIHRRISHNGTDDWLQINPSFREPMASLARRMDVIRKDERPLLGDSTRMLCSSMLKTTTMPPRCWW